MAKAIPCRLVLHGSFKQHYGGEFDSKAAAKQYITEIGWSRPYTIVPIKEVKEPEPEPEKLDYFERQKRVNDHAAQSGWDFTIGNPSY